jgi:glycosyltransferase involved in cell wall biosynthesis
VNAGEPMRIAIDGSVLDSRWGGILKYIVRIADELIAGGDEIFLLANSRRVHHRIEGAHEVGVRVKGRKVWREAFVPAWSVARRPDVFWGPEGILPRFSPVPTVSTIHDLAALRFPGIKPEAHVRQVRTEIGPSTRRADRVIAISEATADDIEREFGVGRERVRIIPNGVDGEFVPGDREAARAAVRERWGFGGPFVLHVGGIEPRKGLDVLIDAAALAAADGAGWRVVLAGTPGFGGEAIEARARESGACDLTGFVTDEELLQLLRAAGALAAPAVYEGFGIPPLEAMACGTPAVIAADSGGLVEVSGPASIVVAERSPEAWRQALEEALGRPPELIERGLRYSERFRWPRVAAETRAVFAEVARR